MYATGIAIISTVQNMGKIFIRARAAPVRLPVPMPVTPVTEVWTVGVRANPIIAKRKQLTSPPRDRLFEDMVFLS